MKQNIDVIKYILILEGCERRKARSFMTIKANAMLKSHKWPIFRVRKQIIIIVKHIWELKRRNRINRIFNSEIT